MTRHADAQPPEDEFEVEKETAAEATAEAAASTTASANPPEGLTEEEQNAWWMKNVYCGDQMRQIHVSVDLRCRRHRRADGRLESLRRPEIRLGTRRDDHGRRDRLRPVQVARDHLAPAAKEPAHDARELHDPELCRRGRRNLVGRPHFGHPRPLSLHGHPDDASGK